MEKTAMFDDRFEVFLADTDFGKSINQQIRYRVFCLERGFEDPTAFPTGEEKDTWDEHSVHFIVREKKTGRWIGSTRLILPEQTLPVEHMETVSEGFLNGMDRQRFGEISRFCIINKNTKTTSQFSHISKPQLDWIGGIDKADQFEITLGMVRALAVYGIQHGLDYSYMFITKSLARLLKRLGISLYQTGPMKEYRGLRAPFLVDYRESMVSAAKSSEKVRAFIERQHLAYVSIAEAEKTCSERIHEQLEDCAECRLN